MVRWTPFLSSRNTVVISQNLGGRRQLSFAAVHIAMLPQMCSSTTIAIPRASASLFAIGRRLGVMDDNDITKHPLGRGERWDEWHQYAYAHILSHDTGHEPSKYC